jgi:predicted GIY-YIG superfamily endonuclease
MKTTLYRHWDKDDNLLYIGISLSKLQRLGQHSRNASWFDKITKVTMESFPTRKVALQKEKEAIITEYPIHNTIHNGNNLITKIKEYPSGTLVPITFTDGSQAFTVA